MLKRWNFLKTGFYEGINIMRRITKMHQLKAEGVAPVLLTIVALSDVGTRRYSTFTLSVQLLARSGSRH